MNLNQIKSKILSISPFVKEVEIKLQNKHPFALIYPNFEALKKANIINIESEIRWYVVEQYNLQADESQKIRGYKIFKYPLSDAEDKNFQINPLNESQSSVYIALKSFISTLTTTEMLPSSHIELDLGLDSLNYVELFSFIEDSFGVTIDEVIFSDLMVLQDLYNYIDININKLTPSTIVWKNILKESIDEKLIYSPFIMSAYKTLLLPLFKLYFRLEIKGLDNLVHTPVIIAPSHQSMLDGFLVEASLPYSTLKKSFFLAFELVFGTSLLRNFVKHGQTILIDANHNLKHSMLKSALPLKEGNNLVIFPEGARTRDGKLLEFRPFFAMLSCEYNVPIIPVVIDGSYKALQSGKIFPRPKKISIRYLEPIYPQGRSYAEITKLTKDAISEDIKNNSLS